MMSDGTPGGTKVILSNTISFNDFNNPPVCASGQIILITSATNNQVQQVVSISETGVVSPFTPSYTVSTGYGVGAHIAGVNGLALYTFQDDLYVADGSGSGKEVSPGIFSLNATPTVGVPIIDPNSQLLSARTAVLFSTYTYTSLNPNTETQAIWRSDGSALGTYQLTPDVATSENLLGATLNGLAFFFNYNHAADVVDTNGVIHSGLVLEATDGTQAGSGYVFQAFADLNGDHHASIIFHSTTDNTLATWRLNDTAIVGGGTIGNPGSGWSVVGAA